MMETIVNLRRGMREHRSYRPAASAGSLRHLLSILFLFGVLLAGSAASSEEGDITTAAGVAFGTHKDVGFGMEGLATVGWAMSRVFSLALQGGVGGGEDLSGTKGWFGHVEAILPAGVNICESVPRVCPGLEFDLSFFPGVGYGWFSSTHTLNVIAGVALDSFRRTGYFDIGVRAAVLSYFDVLDLEGLLRMMNLQLGVVLRWRTSYEESP